VRDAERLREAIGNTLERANIPDMSDEERTRTLTFVVVGAGPTGVELTAELKDFIEEDCPRFYPHLLPYIRIKVYLFLRLFFFKRMADYTPSPALQSD
jgi:NADH:ubiquinone reductase (non-electrogenic)